MPNKQKPCIELVPEPEACVETQAKREHNRVLSKLLKTSEEPELAEKLELLKLFLESADFNRLRSESEPHLIAGKKVRFLLHLEQGNLKYEMKVT